MLRTRLFKRLAVLATSAALLDPVARAADPQPYDVTIAATGDKAIDGALKDSSTLISLQKAAPVGPFALVTRAQADAGRLATALQSFGYYDATVTVRVDGKPLDDPGLPDQLAAKPTGSRAAIAISVERGPLFHLRHVIVEGNVTAAERGKLGIAPGDPVVASQVLAAQNNLLAALRADGHALAKVGQPDAVETPADHVIDVTFHADAGPRVDIGPITITGLKVTDPRYVQNRLTVHSGELYDPAKIDAARQDLANIGIFSAVNASIPDHLDPQGTIPLTYTVTERPRHQVSVNVAYSTDLGPTVGTSFTYRNVFGHGETLTLGANLTQAETDAEIQRPGYNFTATFTQPDWHHRDQTLTYSAEYVDENLYAYSRRAVLGGVAVTRKLSTDWSGSVGVSGVQERVYQEGVTRDYTLAQLPLGLSYDSTGPDGLFNPTHGIKAKLQVTPTEPVTGDSTFFTLVQLAGSTYINLAAEGRSVIAVRGLVGSALGAGTFMIPPDQRFYAGGSGSVRGYAYQSVGPQFADYRPIGGTSVTAGTVEFRQRFGQSLGGVVFVDAGQVGETSSPFTGRVFEGVGAGVRYFTSIGPIRLDIGVPLEKRRKDQIVQAYIGLGQAF